MAKPTASGKDKSLFSLGKHCKSHGSESREIIQSILVHKHKGERAFGGMRSCKLICPRILNARSATKAFGVTLERLMDYLNVIFKEVVVKILLCLESRENTGFQN